MRISDWSSDVCSSDLQNSGKAERHHGEEQECACNLEESTNYAQHSISAFRYGSAIAICGYTARAMALTHARSAGIGATMLYALLRPLLFRLDGEPAHRLTVQALTLRSAERRGGKECDRTGGTRGWPD